MMIAPQGQEMPSYRLRPMLWKGLELRFVQLLGKARSMTASGQDRPNSANRATSALAPIAVAKATSWAVAPCQSATSRPSARVGLS